MENNFYVGIVFHKKKIFKSSYSEKIVLYSEDNTYYVDLINNNIYTTNCNEKDFVLPESIFRTDISDYRVDYKYLLNKYKNTKVKIKN